MTDSIQRGFGWCLPDNSEDGSPCSSQSELNRTESRNWGGTQLYKDLKTHSREKVQISCWKITFSKTHDSSWVWNDLMLNVKVKYQVTLHLIWFLILYKSNPNHPGWLLDGFTDSQRHTPGAPLEALEIQSKQKEHVQHFYQTPSHHWRFGNWSRIML